MYKVATLQILRKSFLPLCSRYLSETGICASAFQQQHILHNSNIQLNSRFKSSLSLEEKPNFIQRTKKRLSQFFSLKTRSRLGGSLTYEKCGDSINYEEFFKKFDMPDTFQSWFSAMQLHVWMCILVSGAHVNSRDFRNGIIDSMWYDVELRIGLLTHMKSSDKKKYLKDLFGQFNAFIISYDEAMFDPKGDTVLAAAAWRTLFTMKHVDPHLLEDIVIYIRKQIFHLDSLNLEEIVLRGKVSFQPLNDVFSNN